MGYGSYRGSRSNRRFFEDRFAPAKKPEPTLKQEDPKPATYGPDWTPGPRGKRAITLRFSPLAWAKIHHCRNNLNKVEISGFAISHKDDPLCVMDFVLAYQSSTSVFTQMDNTKLADFLEDMLEAGYRSDQVTRIWVHTHPGGSANPSGHDERTFDEAFDGYDWAIMCVVAAGAQTARLKVSKPFYYVREIPVEVDWSIPIVPVDYEELNREYSLKVKPNSYVVTESVQVYSYPPSGYQRTQGRNSILDDWAQADLGGSDGWPELGNRRDTPALTAAQSTPTALASRVATTEPMAGKDPQKEDCEWCGQPTFIALLDNDGFCPACQKLDPEVKELANEVAMTKFFLGEKQ